MSLKEVIASELPEFKVEENEEKREIILKDDNNEVVLGYSFTPRGKIYVHIKRVNGEKVKEKRGTRGTLTSGIRRSILYMLNQVGLCRKSEEKEENGFEGK